MTTMYHIEIDSGVITFDHHAAPKVANEYHAPNAKQYFEKRGKTKPQPVVVRGWPFEKMYLISGDEENGKAVAWA